MGDHHGLVHVPCRATVSERLDSAQSGRQSRVDARLPAGRSRPSLSRGSCRGSSPCWSAWDVAAVFVLLRVWLADLGRFDADRTREWALPEDDTRRGSELLLLAAGSVSLVGVAFAFLKAKERPRLWRWCSRRGHRHHRAVLARHPHHLCAAVRAPLLHGARRWHQLQAGTRRTSPTTATSRTRRSRSGMTYQVSDTDITSRLDPPHCASPRAARRSSSAP